MNEEDRNSIFLSCIFLLVDLIIIFFQEAVFYKIIFVCLSLLIIFKISYSNLTKKPLIILILICINIGVIYFGKLKDEKVLTRGEYTLDLTDSINFITDQNQTDSVNETPIPTGGFNVEYAVLISQDTSVRYNYTNQYGYSVVFSNIPSGPYKYEIKYIDIDTIYYSTEVIDIGVNHLMDLSNDKSHDKNVVYEYVMINKDKAIFSDWSEWKTSYTEVKENTLTEVTIELENRMVVPNVRAKRVSSTPIYGVVKIPAGTTMENGIEVQVYEDMVKQIGDRITTTKTTILDYNDVWIKYRYRTRTVENPVDAYKYLYVRNDTNSCLDEMGYIVLRRLDSNVDIVPE